MRFEPEKCRGTRRGSLRPVGLLGIGKEYSCVDSGTLGQTGIGTASQHSMGSLRLKGQKRMLGVRS